MYFMLNIDLKKLPEPISYKDKIMLIGSCFTEHIGKALEDLKFNVLQNPNGILFNPESVSKSLISYIHNKQYSASDLFQLNEVWYSWDHHSRFSHIDKNECLRMINESQQRAHEFLKQANWLVVTLGSSFSYRLTPGPSPHGEGGQPVANCHRAPAQWFDKHLLSINEIVSEMEGCFQQLFQFNSKLKILFTISPVRHYRDGLIENNRSKARLIESVHHLVANSKRIHYFPAYELVIDVLRDYRFYDADLVHPNYAATEFVLEKLKESCIDEASQKLMIEVKKIFIAGKHKAFQPETNAHKQFLASHLEKVKTLKENYPFLQLDEELAYFSGS